jgi:ATP-dependent Lon protease
LSELKKLSNFRELPPEMLRWECKKTYFLPEKIEGTEKCPTIIGQKRGVDALRLGLDIESPGYNVFVSGKVGTGRKTALGCILKEAERAKTIPSDKLYVNNFNEPDSPKLIKLPAGMGKKFKRDMELLTNYILKHLPEVFEGEEYKQRRKKVMDDFNRERQEMLEAFEKKALKRGLGLAQVGPFARPAVLPLVNGKIVSWDDLNTLVNQGAVSKEYADRVHERQGELARELEDVFKKLVDLERKAGEDLKKLDSEAVTPLLDQRTDGLKSKYGNQKINEYLDQVKIHIKDNLEQIQKQGAEKKNLEEDSFLEYSVNLLVDNSDAKEAPVIFEVSPTYQNLFGTIDVSLATTGIWRTNFMKIKAGSLLKADGGFLILEALDVLLESGVWPELKRVLRSGKLEIRHYAPLYMFSISSLKPEPIDLNLKVALVGDPFLYQLLYFRDEDFKKIFKIRADFDSVMDLGKESIREYAGFVEKIVRQEDLLPFEREATARIIEEGVRMAGKKSKLSTQFNQVADIIRESSYCAKKEDSKKVKRSHVELAIQRKKDRSRMIEDKIQESIREGTLLVDTSGSVVGQVNGLAVYDLGDYAFGKPSRITAKVSLGASGIINIEREAELSGKIHSKGMLILAGYLSSRFARNKPLSINASLCFEQSYSGVEGDSASSAEIYALLSALSEIPLKQGIAVTGSVNQKGEIQPIGGVNEKIEGFFETCKAKGLTGEQGVVIPHQNTQDLMLGGEVTEVVRNGKFHIYPIKTVDEGIEILTGVKAGKELESGLYEEGTVNWNVDKKLEEYAKLWRAFRIQDENDRENDRR